MTHGGLWLHVTFLNTNFGVLVLKRGGIKFTLWLFRNT